MTVARSLARGGRALRARGGLVAGLYAVQVGLGLVFSLAVWLALYNLTDRPAFSRGVAGDDLALLMTLGSELPLLRGLAWAGVALLAGWLVASFFLEAGLRGALGGKSFAATAVGRGPACALLWLVSLVPYAAAAAVVAGGVYLFGPVLEDAVAMPAAFGKLLLAAGPGLLLAAVTACAADHGRAELALGDRDSLRALRRGFAAVFTRRAPLPCYLLYLAFWLALGALYVAVTAGHGFGGLGGALALLALRQLAAGGRFLARVLVCGAQMALQLEVVEVRQLAKGAEAGADLR